MAEEFTDSAYLKEALAKGAQAGAAGDASEALLNAQKPLETLPFLARPEDIDPERARANGFATALASEADAETNWRRAFNQKELLSKENLAEKLKEEKLDPHSRGFLEFLSANFDKIAGIATAKPDKLSFKDLIAVAGMNEVDSSRVEAGLEFLKSKYFEISGLDDKVSSQRVERLLFDHAFLLYPKETQSRLSDLFDIFKIAESLPSNFDEKGKRVRAAFGKEDCQALKSEELIDHARIRALQKGIFAGAFLSASKNSFSPQARKQYAEAQKRYFELKDAGINDFINSLPRH